MSPQASPDTDPHSPADTERPRVIDGFSLERVLGRGGFATVWEAVPVGGGPAVAIKIAHGQSGTVVERFRREAEAMQRIGPPFVPAFFGSGQLDDGRPWLRMERLAGLTLADRLQALSSPPPLSWVAAVGEVILAAVTAAHERGFVHRDLKPANVFVAEPDDRAVLLDFGLIRPVARDAERLTESGVAVGTPEYMAPEQLRGERSLDARADLYSFGVMLFELLTLTVPFSGSPAAVQHGHLLLKPRRPSELAAGSRALDEVVLACLAKDPARRPPSAVVLRAMLAEACAKARDATPLPAPAATKLIAEGRQPVIVLMIETRGEAAPVAALITARGGFVPRQRGARYVAVFSGMDTHAPLRSAVAAARELVDGYGARAALHFDDVVLRRRAHGAPVVFGAAVDRPETWLPQEPWSGVVLTPELTRVQPDSSDTTELALTEVEPSGPSFERSADTPIVGREAVVDALATSLAKTVESGAPALVTLVGDPGLGKTRVAAEAAALARRAHPHASVVRLTAAPPGAGDRDRLPAQLAAAILEAPSELPQREYHLAFQALATGLQRRAETAPVAVVLDDAQWADDVVLDALEYATLDGTNRPIWVLVVAQPRFLQVRAAWGSRTRHAERFTLGPLDPAATAQLAGRLLEPAEYTPAAVLERLARWSGGNPASLAEIARALKRAGVVRRRPGGGSFYVATAELDALPPSPTWQWLAARRLAELPPELAACVRLVAVLGAAFSREEVEGVQAAVEAAGGASTSADAGAALRALAGDGLLTHVEGERYAFANALVHDAVYELVDPAQRLPVHRAALAHFRAQVGRAANADLLERLARHAIAAGARAEAADAYLRLGDMAAAKHRHVEADQHYSAALAAAEEGDARRRALALGWRGRSRVYLDRARDAVDDLREAGTLAKSMGDSALVAELLLEEATALDWTRELDVSAQRVDEARPLVAALDAPVLAARLLVAEGRTAWRNGDLDESIRLLERGVAAAVAAEDYPSHIVGLLCLAWQLASAGRLDDAEARSGELIELATADDDLVHVCVGYINRRQLWVARHEPNRAIEDLQRAIALTREIGNPLLERVGCYNVAELLYWSGRMDEALELALRGRMLEERFLERPEPWGLTLIAQIRLERGEYEEAERLVAAIEQMTDDDRTAELEAVLARRRCVVLLKLVLAEMAGAANVASAWSDLLGEARRAGDVDEILEFLFWRSRTALQCGRSAEASAALEEAAALFPASPHWKARFDALSMS